MFDVVEPVALEELRRQRTEAPLLLAPTREAPRLKIEGSLL